MDLHGRFTSVNAGLLAEAGLPRDAVLDQHFASLVHASDRPTALTMVAETLGGRRHRLQMRFLGAKGPRMGIITTAPIHEQGKVVDALGIVVELTAAPDLPAISGDVTQLHQAVSNLLVNAEEALVDFDGERLIRVGTRERD